MSNTINADNGVVSTVPGLKYSADTSGELILQTNTTNALTLDTTQGATFSTGALVTNPYAGSYSSGMVLDHTTSLGRISVAASSAIAFYNGGISARVETMRISSTGNVGIGTATPNTYLTVNFNTSAITGLQGVPQGGISIIGSTACGLTFDTFASNSQITFRRSNGTITSPTALNAGDIIGAITGRGYGTTGWSGGNRGLIQLVAAENFTDAAQGTYWQFNTVTSGTASSTEKMRLSDAGNLGIGTSSPSQVLEVSKSQNTETQVRVVNANAGSSARSGFVLGNDSNAGAASLLLNSSANTGLGGANALNVYMGLNAPIAFFTNATERMRIVQDGNVLVGTTSNSTGAKVNIATDGSAVNRVLSFTNTQASGRTYQILNGGGTAGTFQIYDDTAAAGRLAIDSAGNVGIGTNSPGAKLDVAGNIRTTTYYNFNGNGSNPTDATGAVYDQAFVGPTISGASMSFRTGTPTPSERMRILSTGEVGIGTSSPSEKLTINGTASVNALFTTSGGMYFSNTMYMTASGATIANSIGIRLSESYGALWNCGNSTIWHHSIINGSSCVGFSSAGSNFGNGNILCTGTLTQNYSDVRLKTKVSGIENAVEKLCSIDTFVYVENDVAKSLGYTNTKNQLGVSAQSVQAVFPEVVSLAPVDIVGDPDTHEPISKSGENYLTVDYSRLVPALVAAIQELNAKVIALEAQIPAK